jgi:hypothetical protein
MVVEGTSVAVWAGSSGMERSASRDRRKNTRRYSELGSVFIVAEIVEGGLRGRRRFESQEFG